MLCEMPAICFGTESDMSVLTQLFIQSPLGNQNLRDIKPPLAVQQSLLPYFIVGPIIFGCIIFLVWFYVRKRGQASPVNLTEADIGPLPHEVAYEKLAAIEASGWLKRGDMGTYHTEIAYVLRQYIDARYQIPALEMTTTGLLQAMLHAEIAGSCVERTQQLLANCDIVKFATYQPELGEASTRITDARWIVDQTKLLVP